MWFLFFLGLFCSPQIFAQSFTVEADRLSLPYEKTSSESYVVDAAALADKTTIAQALQSIPGLFVADAGPFGGVATFFLQGQGRGQVKVFIDGVELVNPADIDRSAQLQHFSTAGVKRIEVIKGGQGALYGADASGGVILITTDDSVSSNMRAGLGSHNTWSAGAQTGAAFDDFTLHFDGDFITSDGISSYNESRVVGAAEEDFYKRHVLGLTLKHASTGVGVRVRAVRAKQDIDNSFLGDVKDDDLSLYDHRLYSLFGEHKLLDGRLHVKNNISFTEAENEVENTGFYGQTKQLHSEARYLISPAQALVFFGDYAQDRARVTGAFSQKRQENSSLGASYYHSWHKFFMDQSLRIDWAQAFASRLSGRLGAGYELAPGFSLRGQIATGFKTPTLYQRFSSYGNADLAATKTLSTQLGVRATRAHHIYNLQAFTNDADNQVDFDFLTSRYQNIGETRTYGLEYFSSHKFSAWELAPSVTWMRARNRKTGAELARRPRWFSSVNINYHWHETLVSRLNYRAVSKRQDAGTLPFFDVWELGFSYLTKNNGAIDFDIHNLFDRDYEMVRTYGTLGRSYRLQLRWSL